MKRMLVGADGPLYIRHIFIFIGLFWNGSQALILNLCQATLYVQQQILPFPGYPISIHEQSWAKPYFYNFFLSFGFLLFLSPRIWNVHSWAFICSSVFHSFMLWNENNFKTLEIFSLKCPRNWGGWVLIWKVKLRNYPAGDVADY